MDIEIGRKALLTSKAGGELHVVQDGVILGSIFIPVGETLAGPYLDRLPEGASLAVGKGVAVLPPRSFHGVQSFGEAAYETGANPDYRPTSASRLEREMRLTLNRMQAATTRIEARERAFAAVERVPQAPAEVPPVPHADDDEADVE